MNNKDWNDISKIPCPTEKDILVWDESIQDCRIKSFKLEEEDSGEGNWFDENGYFDDGEPIITHWMYLPERPNKV